MFNSVANRNAANFGNGKDVSVTYEYEGQTYASVFQLSETKPIKVANIFCTKRTVFTFTKKKEKETQQKSLIGYPFPNCYNYEHGIVIDGDTEMSFIIAPSSEVSIDIEPVS